MITISIVVSRATYNLSIKGKIDSGLKKYQGTEEQIKKG